MKKQKYEVRITVTFADGEKLTGTMGFLNSLACLAFEAGERNYQIGCRAAAKEAYRIADQIHEALDARGLYDDFK